jgi:hypothetical protein
MGWKEFFFKNQKKLIPFLSRICGVFSIAKKMPHHIPLTLMTERFQNSEFG